MTMTTKDRNEIQDQLLSFLGNVRLTYEVDLYPEGACNAMKMAIDVARQLGLSDDELAVLIYDVVLDGEPENDTLVGGLALPADLTQAVYKAIDWDKPNRAADVFEI
jgi:hypothetical protein